MTIYFRYGQEVLKAYLRGATVALKNLGPIIFVTEFEELSRNILRTMPQEECSAFCRLCYDSVGNPSMGELRDQACSEIIGKYCTREFLLRDHKPFYDKLPCRN